MDPGTIRAAHKDPAGSVRGQAQTEARRDPLSILAAGLVLVLEAPPACRTAGITTEHARGIPVKVEVFNEHVDGVEVLRAIVPPVHGDRLSGLRKALWGDLLVALKMGKRLDTEEGAEKCCFCHRDEAPLQFRGQFVAALVLAMTGIFFGIRRFGLRQQISYFRLE